MDIERKALICFSLGFIQGALNVGAIEARVILDQKLIEMNQPIMAKEEAEFIQDISDEIAFSLMQVGVNRKDVRGIRKKK